MKNRIMALVLVIALVAVGIAGATMAYFTDTDVDVNVMTIGNVSIEQIEQERDADGNLVDFTQAKPLYPAVYSNGSLAFDSDGLYLNGEYHQVCDASVNNVLDKIVTVKNTGKTDAYMRTVIALECPEGFDGNLIGLNVNTSAYKVADHCYIEVDGNRYEVYTLTHKEILEAGVVSEPSLLQVWLDPTATNEDVEVLDGNGNGTYDILVLSQAVQAAGFADAKTALNTAFGTPADKAAEWFGVEEANIPVTVFSAEELKAAIAAGEKDIVVKGAAFDAGLPLKKDVNVDFVDCTIKGASAWKYANNVTFTNCEFDCGSDNAAIHFDQLYGELVMTNCTIKSGKIQIGNDGDATATFNNCVFGETASTSIWAEKGMRFYCPTVFNNCEFNNRVVLAGSNDLLLTFNACTMNGGTPVFYIDNSNGIIRGGNIPKVVINGSIANIVKTAAELQEALNSALDGDTIILGADITGDVTATQKENVKITIDGNGKTFAGVLTVDGKSATYTTAGLTIKDLTFKADSISEDACIRLGDGTNATRYTCNVTISGCTFDVPGAVGVKSYTGGDKNLTIANCVATADAHSLVQAKGIDGVRVENCEVYSKNGLNFNNSDNVTIIGCEVDVKGYAVRFGESSGGVGAAETYLIKDCALTSANDDGDATIILRGTADYATLTIENTTIVGTPDITNTATGATVVR